MKLMSTCVYNAVQRLGWSLALLVGAGYWRLGALTGLPMASDDAGSVQSMLQHALSGQSGWWQLILLAFLAGVVVSFTPCVYPMLPITIGILQSQARASVLHNFFASVSYVLGIAVVYAGLGYMSATLSIVFGRWHAHPLFILFMVCFFLYLAFSLFGFYEIYVPALFGAKTDVVDAKKSLFHCFVFGLVSGTVASPCLTPVLGMLLGFVAKQENPLVGLVTLFVFSLGMGTLLVIAGTFSSTLTLLPRAGAWMEEVKRGIGFTVLAVCVYFAQPMLNPRMVTALYAAVMAGAGTYFVVSTPGNMVKRLVGVLLLAATAGYLWLSLQ